MITIYITDRESIAIPYSPNWKQPKFPSTGKEMICGGNIHTMEKYMLVFLKRNRPLLYVAWMNLITMLTKRQKNTQFHLSEFKNRQKWALIVEIIRLLFRRGLCYWSWGYTWGSWLGSWKGSTFASRWWWHEYIWL